MDSLTFPVTKAPRLKHRKRDQLFHIIKTGMPGKVWNEYPFYALIYYSMEYRTDCSLSTE
jgi:hypothetical protein